MWNVYMAVKGFGEHIKGSELSDCLWSRPSKGVCEFRFHTPDDLMEMMRDENDYIIFKSFDPEFKTTAQCFFHKEDIVYITQI